MPDGVGSSTPSTQKLCRGSGRNPPFTQEQELSIKSSLSLTSAFSHVLASTPLLSHSERTQFGLLSQADEKKSTHYGEESALCALPCCALGSVWVTQRGVSGSINFSIQNSTHRTRRVAANKLFKVFFFGKFFIHRKIHKNERIVCKYIENWKVKLAQKFL